MISDRNTPRSTARTHGPVLPQGIEAYRAPTDWPFTEEPEPWGLRPWYPEELPAEDWVDAQFEYQLRMEELAVIELDIEIAKWEREDPTPTKQVMLFELRHRRMILSEPELQEPF